VLFASIINVIPNFVHLLGIGNKGVTPESDLTFTISSNFMLDFIPSIPSIKKNHKQITRNSGGTNEFFPLKAIVKRMVKRRERERDLTHCHLLCLEASLEYLLSET
jgi:hypothetical protein